MNVIVWIAVGVSLASTLLAITRRRAIYALIYLLICMVAVAVVLFGYGAPFVAALQIIICAGAIMVMFLFVIMLLNLRPETSPARPRPVTWIVPLLLALVMAGELLYILVGGHAAGAGGMGVTAGVQVEPKQVGLALFGPYVVGVELASMLLLAGLVGAYHLGRR
jgi:NADH-quinone oxidoreductase subunit J